MTTKAAVFLSNGCEEIEAVTAIDLLVRAGIKVTTISVSDKREIVCSRGVVIVAQKILSSLQDDDFDVFILPGGLKGAENFRDSPTLISALRQAHQSHRLIAAICASPAVVFQYHNLFPKAKMTGYPSKELSLKNWQQERVYFDETHQILTSQGPGTAIDFSLKIIDCLLGKAKAAEVAKQLVLPVGIDNYCED